MKNTSSIDAHPTKNEASKTITNESTESISNVSIDVKRTINLAYRTDPLCSHDDNSQILLTIKHQSGHNLRRWQCQNCGAIVGTSSKADEARFGITPVPFDFDKFTAHEVRAKEAQEAEAASRQAEYRLQAAEKQKRDRVEWFAWYTPYLSTDKWKSTRKRVLERDNYTCQACLRATATEVHHLTYDRVKNEPLFDLISVCEICHLAIHAKETS